MRTILALVAVFALTAQMLFAAEPSSPNLMVNGGFENWGPAPAAPADPKTPFPKFGADGAPIAWNCGSEITPGLNNPDIVGHTAIYKDTQVKHSGPCSIRMENAAPTDIVSAYNQVDVEPSTRYRIRCWVKGENIVSSRNDGILLWTRFGPKADFWSKNKWTVQSPPMHLGTFDWQPYEFTVDTEPTSQMMHVTIQLRNASGKVWFDDVEITRIGTIAKVESF